MATGHGFRRGVGGPSLFMEICGVLSSGWVPPAARRPGAAWALLAVCTASPVGGLQAPLDFWTDPSLLRIEIEADLYGIRVEDRTPEAEARRGVMRVLGSSPSQVPILLETRGRFRLDPDNCRYPPLRITVLHDSVATLPPALEGFGRRARLVWSCRPGQEDLVRREYAVYRLRGELDEWAYRVRPAALRFIDASGRDDPRDTWVFFREGNAHLRPRLGVEEVNLPDSVAVDSGVISQVPASLNEVFQYMIGNTDWSISARHNQRLVVRENGEYRTIPYDFDFSGLVNAPYATPGSYLPTTEVTERIFRGLCRPERVYVQAIEALVSREETLLAVIDEVPELSEGSAREARRYLDEFFRDARSPERLARYFGSACQTRN